MSAFMKSVEIETLKSKVGESMGLSPWFEVDQNRIDAFAEATLDHQFIHVDVERAKNTPFGGTIAHGFLTLSLMPYLQSEMEGLLVPADFKMSMNYGLENLRFLSPVKSGARIRLMAVLKSVAEKKSGHFLITSEYTVEIEGESKPALVADWLGLYVL